MNTIKNNSENEIIINKSRFISKTFKIENESDAKEKIQILSKKYNDATHICFAYITNEITRFSDDKEPSGTAGMPILNVIKRNNLNNILVAVIRYFGGVKLGAGGLVRAYSNCASSVIKKSMICKEIKVIKYKISFSYEKQNEVNYLLKDFEIISKIYDDVITYEVLIPENKYPAKLNKIIK